MPEMRLILPKSNVLSASFGMKPALPSVTSPDGSNSPENRIVECSYAFQSNAAEKAIQCVWKESPEKVVCRKLPQIKQR